MAIEREKLNARLQVAFQDADIKITDLAGDNDHYKVEIISESFKGKNKVAQHRMVNEALRGCLGGQLHALSIKTIEK
jgi:stress-induced morphogen